MLYRLTYPPLPRSRPSPAAAVTAGALHVALVWALLQYEPVQQAVRYVVYHYVQPISPNASSAATASRAISPAPLVLKQARRMPVFSNTPESTVPLQATTQLPDTLRSREPEAGARRTEAAPPREQPKPAPAPP